MQLNQVAKDRSVIRVEQEGEDDDDGIKRAKDKEWYSRIGPVRRRMAVSLMVRRGLLYQLYQLHFLL